MTELNRTITLEEDYRKADYEVAKKYGEESILRNTKKEYLPVCDSEPADFGVSSIGLELYFRFLKEMIILFLCLTATAVPPLVFNYMGDQLTSTDQKTVFDASTIANQDGIKLNTTSKADADRYRDSQKKYEYLTVYFDVAMCAVFIVLVYAFRIYNWSSEKKSKQQNLSPANYAVQIFGLPNVMERDAEKELKEFFETRFGKVKECALAREFNDSLALYRNMTELTKEIRKEELRCQIAGKPSSVELEELNGKKKEALEFLSKALPNIDDLESLPINRAFVIFDSLEDKRKCMRAYAHCTCLGCLGCGCLLDDNLRFNKGGVLHRLEVAKAQPPSDIQWENLETTLAGKLFRGLISLICVLLLLVASYAAIYSIQQAQDSLPTQEECLQFVTQTFEQIKLEKDKKKVNCFCSNVDKVKVF